MGLEVLYVIGFLVRIDYFFRPQFSTLLLKNQEILMLKSWSMIIKALWKIYLEVRTLVLACMDMTHSLMMMNSDIVQASLRNKSYE